jgi:hypothetical protein
VILDKQNDGQYDDNGLEWRSHSLRFGPPCRSLKLLGSPWRRQAGRTARPARPYLTVQCSRALRLRCSALVPDGLVVSGHLYDVTSGRLSQEIDPEGL